MIRLLSAFTVAAVALTPRAMAQETPASRAAERQAMMATIDHNIRLTQYEIGFSRLDSRVAAAMAAIPRHEYVPEGQKPHAYENRPLAIGYGQTISQPYIVALMTHLLEPRPEDSVLEVGTGSGYQAAVLGRLVASVTTIEIIPELGEEARERLDRLGFENVAVQVADGYEGWPQRAPFDSILVAAASSHIPPPLIEQLKPGGRMIIPVGGPFSVQHLVLVHKASDGQVSTRQVLPVRFVPLTRR